MASAPVGPENARAVRRSVSINYLVWAVAIIVMVVSATTTAGLMVEHRMSYLQGLALGLAVDASIAVALIGDQLLQRAGQRSRWGTALRWITAGMSLLLNCAQSFQAGDALGVVLHAIPAVLLISLTEAAQDYQLKLAHNSAVDYLAPQAQHQLGDQGSACPANALIGEAVPGSTELGTAVQYSPEAMPLPANIGSVLADMLIERDAQPEQKWGTERWGQALDCAREYHATNQSDVRVDDIQQTLGIGRNRATELRRDVLAYLASHGSPVDLELSGDRDDLVLAPLELVVRHQGERLARLQFSPDPQNTAELRRHLIQTIDSGHGQDARWIAGYTLDVHRADDPNASLLTLTAASGAR